MTTAATANAPQKARKSLTSLRTGTVVSDKRDKTRTVKVSYQRRHPKYGKFIRLDVKYHVHDQNNESREGDRVQIARCRPMSKSKAWRLVRILEKGLENVEVTTNPDDVIAKESEDTEAQA